MIKASKPHLLILRKETSGAPEETLYAFIICANTSSLPSWALNAIDGEMQSVSNQ